MGETPKESLALDYASPDLLRLKRARKVAGFSALVMFMSTIAAAAFSSSGPPVVAFCLWVVAAAAMAVFVIACVKLRRNQFREDETVPGDSTVG